MSDELYPIGFISEVDVTVYAPVETDQFEDGNTATRRYWPARYFKRRLIVTHAPLTLVEFEALREFYAARSGRYDDFWFRDNVNRAGNIKVRFASDLKVRVRSMLREVEVQLDEVAPVPALPGLSDVAAAAGTAPLFWWDANREYWQMHLGDLQTEPQIWDVARRYRPALEALALAGVNEQWQAYDLGQGATFGRTPNHLSIDTSLGTTFFCQARQPAVTSLGVLFSFGTNEPGKAMGLCLDGSNKYSPWICGTQNWGNATYENSPADTWRSIAVVWPAGSDTATLYVNGQAVGSATNTRNYTAGPVAIGGSPELTLPGRGYCANVMVFNAALTPAQVVALHNLFAYQFDLDTV